MVCLIVYCASHSEPDGKLRTPSRAKGSVSWCSPCHVFWQVGSSATLGTNTEFAGSILALTSITANTGATVDGRLLARNGAVILDKITMAVPVCITVPEPGSMGLLVSGLSVLGALSRRRGK